VFLKTLIKIGKMDNEYPTTLYGRRKIAAFFKSFFNNYGTHYSKQMKLGSAYGMKSIFD
jgi:hypothetical protein